MHAVGSITWPFFGQSRVNNLAMVGSITWPSFWPKFCPERWPSYWPYSFHNFFVLKLLFFPKISCSLQKEEDVWKTKKTKMATLLTYDGQVIDPTAYIYIYIYIYMHAVKLQAGPRFGVLCVKQVQVFSCFFWKSRSPSGKKRIFQKIEEKKQKWPNSSVKKLVQLLMLRNILGPVVNTSLDQFLTLGFLFFCVVFSFLGGLKPLFLYCFRQKMQNLKKHTKEKTTLFVSTPVLTALVPMSFFLRFSFLGFCNFQIFERCFW